ncbi:hypothetical protein [Streptomyces sp. NPDC004270]
MLNGYRAVVTSLDDEHRVEVTWRVKDSKAEGGFRYESGWMTPDQIASGSLSLGYAMTVAASQGLTCNTSLLYGHGANAFATYPGITRARRGNHIWLPLDVVESEQTQARLGAARSERERLERAIHAFAEFLGQSRPDSMVSDILFAQPEPASPPPQRDRAAEEAQADDDCDLQQARDTREPEAVQDGQAQDEARRQEQPRLTDEQIAKLQRMRDERAVPPWTTRPYGDTTNRTLNKEISNNEKLAEEFEDLARQNDVAARALADQLERDAAAGHTRGQQYAGEAGALLDAADQLLNTAHRELARGEEKGWLTLRLAGSSRKEQRELHDRYTGERVAARTEQVRAQNAARHAVTDAWKLVKESRFASNLGVSQYERGPEDIVVVADRFAEMRTAAERTGHRIDVRDQQRVGRLTGKATTQRGDAERARARAAQASAEKTLRTEIAAKHPQLHDMQSAGRRAAQQQREAREARAAAIRARNEQSAAASYTGPSQGRSSGRNR